MIEREEMILNESWYSLCDYHYNSGMNDCPAGIVHCDLPSIPEFFNKIKNSARQYIVISSRSDYGLCYQRQFPPWLDYEKAAGLFITDENTYHGYRTIDLPPRVNLDKCKPTDTYSIKCYSYTEATFNEIPRNVKHWFLTNCMIEDSRLTAIPFGMNGTDGNVEALDVIEKADKNKDRPYNLYVNFQFYTIERLRLFHLYKTLNMGITERNVPFPEFIDRLSTHLAVLCPNGNGIDCYRTWEAIYMGCVPIVEFHPGTLFLAKHNLPVLFASSMYRVDDNLIKSIFNMHHTNLNAARFSYWKKLIEDKANQFLSIRKPFPQ